MTAFKPLCVVSALVQGAPLLYQPLFGGRAAAEGPPPEHQHQSKVPVLPPVPLPVPGVPVALSAWHDARAQVRPAGTKLACGLHVSSEVSAKVYAKAAS